MSTKNILSIVYLMLCMTHSLHNNVAKTPALGWSSWNSFINDVNETLIMKIANATISLGLNKVGYEYINIDAGYLTKNRNTTTKELIVNSDKFPHGMRYLSDYIHSLGLKLGIYTDLSNISCGLGPGSFNHYDIDAKTFINDWNVDYIKVDMCNHTPLFLNPQYQLQLWQQFRDSLLNTAMYYNKSNIYYSICPRTIANGSYISTQIPYNGQEIDCPPMSWNVSDHISTANSWLIEYRNNMDYWYNADNNKGLITNIDGFIQMGFKVSSNGYNYTNIAHISAWNDMDMLQCCNFGHSKNSGSNSGMSLEEYRSEFSIWAVLSSPLIQSMDYRNILNQKYGKQCLDMIMNKNVIDINQNTKYGHFGQLIYQYPDVSIVNKSAEITQQIFYKIIQYNNNDISYAIVLFNRDSNTQNITLKWNYMSIQIDTCLQLTDIWNNITIGHFTNQYSAMIASHNILLLNATICS
eukprot:35491_1